LGALDLAAESHFLAAHRGYVKGLKIQLSHRKKLGLGIASMSVVSLMLVAATSPSLSHPLKAGFASGKEYLAGYLIIPTGEKVDSSYNAGFSMYVAVWPLLKHYPGHQFQTGLPGTWMFAQPDGEPLKDMYSDIEGGLGWWRDTRFPTETPKFIMGGVAPNFSKIANNPSHGWGTWEKPRGLYGVAQLSPWVVFPIDGLNLKQGTCGDLFGYGYMNLPLTDAKPTTDGKDFPTGNNCWTLFLNTKNFKGPLAFFLPYFWSESQIKEPRFKGQLLDTRPSDPNRHIQMETQYIPCSQVTDSRGESYARIAPTAFPRDENGVSVLVHRDSTYNKSALWNSVNTWFNGGAQASGRIEPAGAFVRTFTGGGSATWNIRSGEGGKNEVKVPISWKSFATPKAIDANTFGYDWNYDFAGKGKIQGGALVNLPEYYHLENGSDPKKAKWVPVKPESVPVETGLHALKFDRPVEPIEEPYTTPDAAKSDWKIPGPVAGPFKVKLGDGSTITYSWYRFADQPALLNAGMTSAEREKLQKRVEMLHRNWTKDKEYLPAPTRGKLASIDPAQLVKPPKGYEIGYVPIATKQEMVK